jgi:hypothetical protein
MICVVIVAPSPVSRGFAGTRAARFQNFFRKAGGADGGGMVRTRL